MNRTALIIGGLVVIISLLGASCSTKTKSAIPTGGVYKSVNAGQTWSQVVLIREDPKGPVTIAGISINKLIPAPLDSSTLYGLTSNGLFVTRNAGQTWERIFNLRVEALAVSDIKYNTLLLASGHKIFRTVDGGKNWENVYIETTPKASVTVLGYLDGGQIYYAGTSKGVLLRSLDGGSKWQQMAALRNGISSLSINSSTVIYVTANELWRSTDGGVSWTNAYDDINKQLKINPGNFYDAARLPGKSNGIIFASKYGIFRTIDGISWQNFKILTAPNTVAINSVTVHPKNSTIYYSTDGAIFRSDDGINWVTLSSPAGREVKTLAISLEGTLYAGIK